MELKIKGSIDYSIDELREELVHSIYALVDDPDKWLHALQRFDALLNHPGHMPRSKPASSMIAHIHRADLLLSEIDKLKLSHKQNDQIIDSIPTAIVLMQPNGYIVSANRRAKKLLKQIHVSNKHRRLHFLKEKHQSAFMQAIHNVHAGLKQGEAVRLGDTKLWISRYSNNQLAVFFSDHSSGRYIHTETLQQMYGMTPQEANITAKLYSGKGYLDQVANELNISIHTVRTHLKKAYAKTGAHNQAEFMKIITLNPALTLLRDEVNDSTAAGHLCRLTKLYSGRTISWAEYGDPAGAPVLLCHAITGCRLLPEELTKGLARKHIRLIVPDRAGYGLSSPATRDVMEQWLEDMHHFIPQLGIDSCDIIGHSAGGTYAMALAVAYPSHVRRLHLISSPVPLTKADDPKHLLSINRILYHLIRKNPGTARAFLNFSMRNAVKKPHRYFEMIMSSLPDADRHTLKTNQLKERLVEGFTETHRQGVTHLTEEVIYIFNHWHIQASEIRCPTIIWHGLEDKHAPAFLMQRFEQSLPDCSKSNWLADQGHYLLFSHWNQIVKHLGAE